MKSDDDAGNVALAQGIKHILANWAMQVELIGLKAKIARARFLALRREGFSVDEALNICIKDSSI